MTKRAGLFLHRYITAIYTDLLGTDTPKKVRVKNQFRLIDLVEEV